MRPWVSGRRSVGELYSKTAVDQAALKSSCEQLMKEQTPLSGAAQNWLTYMEAELGSTPGTAAIVMAGLNAIG